VRTRILYILAYILLIFSEMRQPPWLGALAGVLFVITFYYAQVFLKPTKPLWQFVLRNIFTIGIFSFTGYLSGYAGAGLPWNSSADAAKTALIVVGIGLLGAFNSWRADQSKI